MIGKLSEPEIDEVLKDNTWGHIGCNDGFNTYVYPLNYFYDGRFITCHSQNGAKVKVMRQNKRVCFQIDEVDDHQNWKSVMVLGEFQEITDERERYDAMKAFVDRQMRVKMTERFLETHAGQTQINEKDENSRPVIYRILIDEKTGQFEMN